MQTLDELDDLGILILRNRELQGDQPVQNKTEKEVQRKMQTENRKAIQEEACEEVGNKVVCSKEAGKEELCDKKACAEQVCAETVYEKDVCAEQTVVPYINREKSWLKFNERVLEEAEDPLNPLMERLKFIGIFASNLDEFFMVRVGSLFDELSLDEELIDKKSGMNAQQQLDMIFAEVCRLSQRLGDAYDNILAELAQHQYYQVDFADAEPWLLEQIEAYFQAEVLPLLSPQIINPRHPFPFFNNEELYIGARLKDEDAHLAIVPIPTRVPRKLLFHSEDKAQHFFILIENMIAHYMPQIFNDEENDMVAGSFVFRVTRNGDMDLDEGLYDADIDWRLVMEQLLKRRNKQAAVRIQFSRPVEKEIWQYLCNKLQLTEREMIVERAPLDLSFCFGGFDGLESKSELFYEPRYPVALPGIDRTQPMMEQIAKNGDLMLVYPYHSMRPFIDLLEQAAIDPDVISIKITLYRVASGSRIVNALMRAAENGKDVLVLVELRARFDEQHNIDCSKKLEDAGCTVIYGVEHYKVHTKLMVMTYRKHNKIQYITQIGTGNYNEKTASLYTDLSLITANAEIGREATEVFKHLALGQFVDQSNHLLVAPEQMKQPLMALIDREIGIAKQGDAAKIIIKTNSLSHKAMIDKLIEASQAGVEVILLVRGICCLQAGIPGVSDNIRIHSIVGRYLEHSRIFSFGIGERQQIYIGSADWMTRNMDYRVEVAVEVLDPSVKKTLNQMLDLYLSDNRKLRTMDANGYYLQPQRGEDEPIIDSQVELFDYFSAKVQKQSKKEQKKQKDKRDEKRNHRKKSDNDSDKKSKRNEKHKDEKKKEEKQKEEKQKTKNKKKDKLKHYGFLKKKDKKK